MPVDYLSPDALLPSGADLYQSAQAKWAATQAANEPTALATSTAPLAPPPEELYAPYRARKGITFDVYAEKGKPQAATLDDLLTRREEFADWQVTVKDKDGQRKGIAVRDMDQALAEGFKLEGSHETRTHEYVEANKGLRGDARVALTNFTDELFLGIPGIIEQHTSSPQELANLEALKNDHELANAVGGLTGFAGSLVAGGPLFKGAVALGRVAEAGVLRAAERVLATRLVEAGVETGAKSLAKSLVAKSLGGGAKLGVEAATIAAPKAITEAALGDPDAAAETMVWSMGAGAALGTLAPAAREIFGRASKVVFATPASIPGKLETYANAQALKSHNPYLKFSQRLTEIPGGEEAAGKIIREHDLVRRTGEGFEELTARTSATKESIGQQLGAHYEQLDKYGALADAKAVANTLRAEVLAPLEGSVGFEGKATKVRRYIESFLEKTGAGAPPEPELLKVALPPRPPAGAAADVLASHAVGLESYARDVAAAEAVNAERLARFEAAKAMPAELKAKDLLNIRRDLDELVYGEKMPGPDQVDKSYKAIRGILKKTLDEKAGQLEGPQYLKQLDKLNTDFRVLSILEKNAQKNIGRDITNRTNSLTDYLAGGGLTTAGAFIGGSFAGPAGAALGAGAGKLVGMFGNKYLRENYNSLAVKGADKLGVLFAEQALRRSARELDRVPEVLGRLTGTVARDAAEAAPVRALTALFGSEGSRGDRYQHAAELLDGALANMDATSQRVADIAGGLAEGGAPSIATAFTAKTHTALAYLQRTMPRAKSVLPSLFGPKGKYVPSEREMSAWEKRAEIVSDPFMAFRHLETGTLTKEHIEALDAVYPSLAAQLRERITLHAADPEAPVLPPAARAQVALLLGGAPGGGKSMRRYQANFETADESDAQATIGGGGGRGPKLAKIPSLETSVQRLSNR